MYDSDRVQERQDQISIKMVFFFSPGRFGVTDPKVETLGCPTTYWEQREAKKDSIEVGLRAHPKLQPL